MKKKKLLRKIRIRKILLNFLMKYFNPCNKFMVALSQNLDNHIAKYQYHLYKLNKRKFKDVKIVSKIAA